MEQAFGKYQLIRKLATGGMAEVFLARSAGPGGFEKILVLKRVLPHLSEDPRFLEMFLKEAKLAAQLNHPNVVQIFDLGEHEGEYFLAMEYIEGPTLRAVIRAAAEKRLALPLAFCAKVASLASEGLAYAHDFVDPASGQWLGLVHRDVSPENILVSRAGAVKVVDFGIAKAAAVSQTKSHSLRGKYGYMAPEQLRRRSALDRRVDVYALGVVLYELVTGQRPFDAVGELAVMRAILSERIVSASKRRRDVPPMLDEIFERALGRREDRYPTCHELHADLERLVHTLGGMSALQVARVVTELGVVPRGTTGQYPAQGVPGVTRTAASLVLTSAMGMDTTSMRPPHAAAATPTPPANGTIQGETRLFDPHVQRTELGTPPDALGAGMELLAPPLPAEPTGDLEAVGLLTADAVALRTRIPRWAQITVPIAAAGLAIALAIVVRGATPAAQDPHDAEVVESPPPTPTPMPAPPPALPTAAVRIESNVGGELRVNGKLVGFAPLQVTGLSPGTIHVQVSDVVLGFSKEDELTLHAGDNGTRILVVEKTPLEFKLTRGTEVFVDGRALGRAPVKPVEVYEGPHWVRTVAHGKVRDRTVIVSPARETIVQ